MISDQNKVVSISHGLNLTVSETVGTPYSGTQNVIISSPLMAPV
jgi:hypothetical protein